MSPYDTTRPQWVKHDVTYICVLASQITGSSTVCFFNRIFRPITQKVSKPCITDPLWGKSIGDRWFLSHNWMRTHDDVIKWKHFPRYWPFVRGIYRSPVNSPHQGQWRGALVFSLICAWTNFWASKRDAGDLRRHRARGGGGWRWGGVGWMGGWVDYGNMVSCYVESFTGLIQSQSTQHGGCRWPGAYSIPVASFTKEVDPRLAKRSLETNGRLANRELISLVKEATGHLQPSWWQRPVGAY